MKDYSQYKINRLPEDLFKVGDLIWFEGPLQSIFKNKNDEPYIYDWVDMDDKTNRWLVIKTTKELLKKYITKKISYRTLILDSIKDTEYVYFDDHNINQKYRLPKSEIIICFPDFIKKNYEEHFFDPDLTTNQDSLKKVKEYLK